MSGDHNREENGGSSQQINYIYCNTHNILNCNILSMFHHTYNTTTATTSTTTTTTTTTAAAATTTSTDARIVFYQCASAATFRTVLCYR
jgi:hypothetical protein